MRSRSCGVSSRSRGRGHVLELRSRERAPARRREEGKRTGGDPRSPIGEPVGGVTLSRSATVCDVTTTDPPPPASPLLPVQQKEVTCLDHCSLAASRRAWPAGTTRLELVTRG
ncbi:hypothetical protein GN956_G22519 [Arapaima gigas]